MKLKLIRERFHENETIGKLYVNNVLFSCTLEPTFRGLHSDMNEDEIKRRKIYGVTAIPKGSYHVILTFSKRFQKILPEILHVKGFVGVRIHAGNYAKDTQGCILLGNYNGGNYVSESRQYVERLVKMMQGSINDDEGVTITIE